MTSVMSPPDSGIFKPNSDPMNTLQDPRSPTPPTTLSRQPSGSDHTEHPDLSKEVATLSTKLINAINHQTSLDDSLQATRHELEAARAQIARLEAARKEHEALISQGLLLKKEVVDRTEAQLKGELAEERSQRAKAETQKKRMEGEVESLTAALFEEANEMVATARRDTEASEKRTEQLQKRLNDTEALLTSHQEQLQELKAVMQDMGSDRGDAESYTASAPSTPAIPSKRMSHGLEPSMLTPIAPGQSNIEPDQPLKFSYLFHTVLRTDQAHYEDFKALLGTTKTAPNSRATSGNFTALASKGLGSSG
ncbi:hypothetical protein LTS18_000830, partial [Coniosporium uncinatum]